MKWIKYLSIALVLIGAVDSCIKEPSFSSTPHIDLESLVFKRGSSGVNDTLIFKVKFRDGDGDLGYGPVDANSLYYYNPWYWAYSPTSLKRYITDSNISPFSLYDSATHLKYDDPRLPHSDPRLTNMSRLPDSLRWINWKAKERPKFSTLPGIDCKNWEQLFCTENVPVPVVCDTVYITQNLWAYNINVDLYSKVGTSYVLYDPEKTNIPFSRCISSNLFRATFPDLSIDRSNSPLEGTITFRLESARLYTLFGSDKLKVVITINDRAFHVSNPVTKADFTLQQITK